MTRLPRIPTEAHRWRQAARAIANDATETTTGSYVRDTRMRRRHCDHLLKGLHAVSLPSTNLSASLFCLLLAREAHDEAREQAKRRRKTPAKKTPRATRGDILEEWE